MSDTSARNQDARAYRVTSLAVDAKRLGQFWDLTPAERVAAARAGRLTLGEMLRWASRVPQEVPLIDGEFFFITALSADAQD